METHCSTVGTMSWPTAVGRPPMTVVVNAGREAALEPLTPLVSPVKVVAVLPVYVTYSTPEPDAFCTLRRPDAGKPVVSATLNVVAPAAAVAISTVSCGLSDASMSTATRSTLTVDWPLPLGGQKVLIASLAVGALPTVKL